MKSRNKQCFPGKLDVHRQDLFDEIAVVRKARHLVLSAELAAAAQPVVEKRGTRHDDFEFLERDVLIALGIVV